MHHCSKRGLCRRLALFLCILSLSSTALDTVQAHSTAWPTITRSEHLQSVRHEILPKGYTDPRPVSKRGLSEDLKGLVTKHDMVRIKFAAYNTTFHLHLEPNLDLLHTDLDLGDETMDNIMAFKGVVVQDEHHSDRKWDRAARSTMAEKHTIEHMLYEDGVLGWARMMIEHDPENEGALVMRGAFQANGDTFHVTTQQHYVFQKRTDDALPSTASSGKNNNRLVVFRDSDLYTRSNSMLRRRKRGLEQGQEEQYEEPSPCGSETLLRRSREAAIANGQNEATLPPLTHGYYYPPNLTTSIPDPSASWAGMLKEGSLHKRAIEIRAAGPDPIPDGCPKNRVVNYMGVAADCTYVRHYQGVAAARKQILADFNTASQVYESTFNIALGVIALNIIQEGCPTAPVKGMEWNQECSAGYPIEQRLSDFSNWRGQGERPKDGAGLWHLMTTCKTGPVVGIAWTKAVCQSKTQTQTTDGKQQYTAGTGVSSASPNEWMIVAHEIGHNFGAVHDCTLSTCPASTAAGGGGCCPYSEKTCDAGGRYIMNPSEATLTKLFSPCSIKTICHNIKNGAVQCLKQPGTRTTQSTEENICGNGLKEAGEDCDCGSAEDCAKDPCCDGATCKFKNNAVCDDLNDSCCLSCKFRPAGYVCRAAISECDIQEVCTGSNAVCPTDERVPNGDSCKGTSNSTGLQCANGLCTSRDLQCKQQDHAGITKQCGASNGCELTCNDPGGSPLSCVQIQGAFFVDGTPCGFGGTCNAGVCEYKQGVDGVMSWIKNNLPIFIPVASIVGLILLCCIWSCCCSGCSTRRRDRLHGKPQRLNSNGYQYAGFAPPAEYPPSGVPPQQYPMAPMGPMAPPPPTYQTPQQPVPYAYHPNDSNNHENPFGNHNAQNFNPNQPRPNPTGYI